MTRIIVDITVGNMQIIAGRPADTYQKMIMPNDDVGKMMFWNSVPLNRLNSRKWGYLKGNALKKAQRLVDKHGGINTNGEYGSIQIEEKEFVPRQ